MAALRGLHGIGRTSAQALGLALALALAAALTIAAEPWLDLEQDIGLAWLYSARGPALVPPEVLVVAIDEAATLALGQPSSPRDWPRSLHAELVQALAQAGARLIVFDMSFELPSGQPARDLVLARAMGKAGNVLVTDPLRKSSQPLHDARGRALAQVTVETTLPPIPAIAEAVWGHAPFMLPKAARVDAYWTFRNRDIDAPTLPVLALSAWAALAPPDERAAQIDQVQARRQRLHAEADASYLWLYGPPRTVPTLGYDQVLQRGRDVSTTPLRDLVGGKAVFIGFSASTPGGQDRLRDDHRTVFSQDDGLNISGVELAATAFANLLHDRPLRPLTAPQRLAVAGAWALLLALLCTVLRPAWAMLVSTVLAAAWLWWVLRCFSQQAWWWPSVVPLAVQWPLALFAGTWLHYRRTERERALLKRSFGYYLPGALVDQLSLGGGGGAMTESNRVVYGSCLSSDASKYTSLAENMDPASLGRLLNDYYAELFVPVERSGGQVVDVVGDAMVAIWVAPEAAMQARRQACEAALTIASAIDRFNQARPGQPVMETRFGLHCGELMVGNVGASRHYEYRAVGDIINTASRLEGLNKPLGTRLLASADTVAGLPGLSVRPLGAFLLVGKAKAVAVVELRGLAAAASAQDRALCVAFAQALQHYGDRQWPAATMALLQLLQRWPDDGPALFYLQRCRQLLTEPTEANWSPVVTMTVK